MKLPIKNNRIVVDLNKVVWANLIWSNGKGNTREQIPSHPYFSVNGMVYSIHDIFKGTNAGEYCKKHNLIDVWTPELTLQLGANHRLVYTGTKALSIWEAWKAKIFGGSK